MKHYFFTFTFITLLFSVGCKNDSNKEDKTVIENAEPTFIDDPNAEVTAADTSSNGVYQEEVDETGNASLKEAMQNMVSTEIVEEGGLSFCDCVKKQKKLLDLAEKTEDDDVLLKALADLNAMKTEECKVLFSGNQSTIDEKEEHERKVKKCLNQK